MARCLRYLRSIASRAGLASRSAAVRHALHLLRQRGLEDDYASAFEEWDRSGDRAAWEPTSGDGLT